MTRNFFLTASISIAILGINMKSFRPKKRRLYILSLLIMVFSIIYGIKATLDFNDYLNYLKEKIYRKDGKDGFI